MTISVFLFVPLVIFLGLVAPLWLTFHYLTHWKRMKSGGLADGQVAVDATELRRMAATADKLSHRLDALEAVLGQDAPEWRKK